jgi:hypothetical protein
VEDSSPKYSSPDNSSLENSSLQKKFPTIRAKSAKNHPDPDEECSGEESTGRRMLKRRRTILAINYLSKELSGEESFGRRILRRKMFCQRENNFGAKNSPAKNPPRTENLGI